MTRKIRADELDRCVAVTAYASREADLDEAAFRLARTAFEAYKPEGRWLTADGRPLHVLRRGYAEPHAMTGMGSEVVTWQADYLVGTSRREQA